MALCTPNATPVFGGIPSEPGNGPIPGFMELISRWPTAIPNDSIWSIEFDTPTSPIEIAEPKLVGDAWNLARPAFEIATNKVTKTFNGWYRTNMLASSVKLIGESLKTERVGSAGSEGYLRGIVSAGRDDFSSLDVAFIETHYSFADYIIRPWLIAIAKESLIARNNSKRVNITCTMYGLNGKDRNPIKRKSFTFFNAFPVSVDEEEYNFTESEVNFRKVSFNFTHYAMTPPGEKGASCNN